MVLQLHYVVTEEPYLNTFSTFYLFFTEIFHLNLHSEDEIHEYLRDNSCAFRSLGIKRRSKSPT